MGERTASADAPLSEALATTGLFLNLASVIAIAVCLASWSASDVVWATAAGVAALLTFAASLVCFGKQAEDREVQQIA